MKKMGGILLLVIVITGVKCKSRSNNTQDVVNKLADVECRAINLREQRFALANELRFTQDTLTKTTSEADKVRLTSKLGIFNKKKEDLLKQSLSLADSIHKQLEDIFTSKITNEKDKKIFNKMLDSTLSKKGCIRK